jgi:hypothetical protein
MRITGRLRMTVQGPGGTRLAERRAGNIVLREGAAIVAGLFAGDPAATRIDTVQVGFGTDVADADATALTAPPDGVDAAAVKSPIALEDFTITTDGESFVHVGVSATFTPSVELTNVTEAGLLAGTRLYNQVVFEPVNLRVGQDVTFFWEIEFPFGH